MRLSPDYSRVAVSDQDPTWENVKSWIEDTIQKGKTRVEFFLLPADEEIEGSDNDAWQWNFEKEIKQRVKQEFPDMVHFDMDVEFDPSHGGYLYDLWWLFYSEEVDWRPTEVMPEDYQTANRR